MLPEVKRFLAYVEDDEEDIELFQEVASAAGLEVRVFPNGEELLHYLKENPGELPCLILLDMKNPVISGPETYARLQQDQQLCAIPVKYFSSSHEMMEREQRDAPGVELVTKPDMYNDWISLITRFSDFCKSVDSSALS